MKYEQTVKAVNNIISQYSMPLTLRQIYYRLVVAGLILNKRSTYNQLSSQVVTARERRGVDENRLVDRSRRIDNFAFDTPTDFLDAALYTLKQKYVRRYWTSQPVYVEVWVEKDALSEVMANAVYPLNTIVAPSRGYSSYSYLRDASRRIIQYADTKPTIVLHFADHDPSGLDMSRDLEERLVRYSSSQVEVRRIALTYDQVQQYNLIPNPTKDTDTRCDDYKRYYGDECWELDAIEPNELVRICATAVEALIEDWDAWNELKMVQENENKQLRELLEKTRQDFVGEEG